MRTGFRGYVHFFVIWTHCSYWVSRHYTKSKNCCRSARRRGKQRTGSETICSCFL